MAGPAARMAATSPSPQQCRPAMARCSTSASAPEERSTAASGASGKPGRSMPARPGSSIMTTWAQPGRAAVTASCTVRRWVRTARAATSNAVRCGRPAWSRARPRVTGPVACHLTGARRPLATSRKVRRLVKASCSRSTVIGRPASNRDWSTRRRPSPSGVTPAMPTAAWANIASAGDRRGSEGTAGRAGRGSSPNSAAARGSVCGRLPAPVAAPEGSWTFTPVSLSACPPPRSVRHARERLCEGTYVGRSHPVRQIWNVVPAPLARSVVWALRALWAALVLLAGPAFAGALDGRSAPVQATAAVGLWVGWAVVLVAALVPTTTSLTVVRVIAPASVLAAALAAATGASAVAGGLAVVATLVVTLVAFAPEVARVFVQGSAYGDEARFPLRPPGPLLLGPIPLAWATLAVAALAGPLLLAAKQWLGVPVTIIAVALAVVLARRFHRLSRRWFVLVPAGLVVHDHLVLADTAMFRTRQVRELALARAGTTATDLTGTALGGALEVTLAEDVPVLMAGTLQHRSGQPRVVQAVLVAPSRPGLVLAEAQRRGYRVAAAATAPPRT